MPDTSTDTYYLFGALVRFLQRSSQTGGAYCLAEALVAPGAGAPPNRHPGDDEAFYVLDGRFEFMIDGAMVPAGVGSFVKVPPGAPHAFRNVGTEPARLLVLNTPGRVHDGFFSEVGRPMPPGTATLPPPDGEVPDIPRLVEIARRNGLELLVGEAPHSRE
ncbi:cupin domain-containing protein [Ancylobacter oerskovii]|uniref:Cupin domain-containing protein n=1 Tax=Ancylobacter oerskovii TaxID=459519 RepID=A0ABW4Z1K3_9HYPH|nr:cupin domain-containing protein [Ancylobacter oerskovii]MBS7542569.1 cupin domain-containing protein [Ancylobacter oerskovii]